LKAIFGHRILNACKIKAQYGVNDLYTLEIANFALLIPHIKFKKFCCQIPSFEAQSRKNRGCLSLISNMGNQFSAKWAALKKLPKKIQL
jgi:hypothetical protein